MPTEADKNDPETDVMESRPQKNGVGKVFRVLAYMIIGTLALGLLLFGTCLIVN